MKNFQKHIEINALNLIKAIDSAKPTPKFGRKMDMFTMDIGDECEEKFVTIDYGYLKKLLKQFSTHNCWNCKWMSKQPTQNPCLSCKCQAEYPFPKIPMNWSKGENNE